jgi:uncharacterized membrane protein YfcA
MLLTLYLGQAAARQLPVDVLGLLLYVLLLLLAADVALSYLDRAGGE